MKKLNFKKNMDLTIRTLLVTFPISCFAVHIPTTVTAQDAKVDKAVANFCNKLGGVITALDALDQANETGTYNEFTKAYNKTVKAWNKFVKSADKLEKVEYKESEKAYNDLVDAVNLVQGDKIDDKTGKKIDKHVDSASDTILSLQTMECK